MTRRGLLGGTFDPIHVGHLDVAEAARRALSLDQILVVPARVPPHRQSPFASAAHRFAMVAIAVASRQGLLASDLEMGDSDRPSYTTATLDRIAERGEDPTSLFLVTGADAFREIDTWMGYPHLLDRCHFVVVSRPGCPAPALRAALPHLADRMIDTAPPAGRPAIVLVDAPTAPVSSTEVRRRLAAGEPIAGLVPDAVAAHISRHRLYASAREGQA